MKKNNLMSKWKVSEEELNKGLEIITKEIPKIKDSKVMNAIEDFMKNGDVRVSELDYAGNWDEFLVGDVVKIIVSEPTCGMVRVGEYKGVVVDHPEIGLCIALHDMNLVIENSVSYHYPQFFQVSGWENHEIELLYREQEK